MSARETEKQREQSTRQLPTPVLVALAVALVVVMVVFGRFCSTASTISVTVNGAPLTLHGAKTMETAIRESGLPINPGDLISLKGNILKRSEGYPFHATVNGEETTDPNRGLGNGDEIIVSDGEDRVEDYDVQTDVSPHKVLVSGAGSICTFEAGTDGVVEHRTGHVSGEEITHVVSESTPSIAMWHRPDVGDDKVIALTFDEGPSEDYTEQILNVLSENDAKATFFCVGTEAEAHPNLVQLEWGTYNQVGTNTYDREITTSTSAEWIAKQVEDGLQAVRAALGSSVEIPRIVRFPNALLTSEMAAAIDDDVDAVLGWDLDTADWMENGPDQIYDVLMEAEPGNIVALRDGGGDRSATVSALQRALPELKRKGYSFITIEELMRYPALETD